MCYQTFKQNLLHCQSFSGYTWELSLLFQVKHMSYLNWPDTAALTFSLHVYIFDFYDLLADNPEKRSSWSDIHCICIHICWMSCLCHVQDSTSWKHLSIQHLLYFVNLLYLIFLTHIAKMWVCNDQCSSVRPAGHIRKLNVGLFLGTVVSTQTKLCMIITTIKFYASIPLLVTFDLYLGHRVSIYEK